MNRLFLVYGLGLMGALLLAAAAEACAVCGTGPGIAGDPTARGFYWGILFLMAMPFAVVGSIAGWLMYRYWRASTSQRRKAPARPFAWARKESEQ